MKETFAGWYRKTPEELKHLWNNAIIVPDTNILLHLLRHSAVVRGQLMAVFEQKQDSLWIPYQVGAEFQKHRLDVQQHALDAYDQLVEDVTATVNQAKNKLNQYRAHPVIEVEREVTALEVYLSDFRVRMSDAKAKHPTDEFATSFEKVTGLFAGRVGAKPCAERTVAVLKEGDERYAKKIPPGFADAKKSGDGDKYGDLLVWKDMIDKAKTDQKPIIFVTDDGKSDWWYIHRGKKIGPHPALIEEFLSLTGQKFHLYELPQFLRYAADSGSGIQADAVRRIAETVVADSELSALASDNEREQAAKILRAELRSKETELDNLIKSLIDLPPSSPESIAPEIDTKRTLKVKISELTEMVGLLREQLSNIERAGPRQDTP